MSSCSRAADCERKRERERDWFPTSSFRGTHASRGTRAGTAHLPFLCKRRRERESTSYEEGSACVLILKRGRAATTSQSVASRLSREANLLPHSPAAQARVSAPALLSSRLSRLSLPLTFFPSSRLDAHTQDTHTAAEQSRGVKSAISHLFSSKKVFVFSLTIRRSCCSLSSRSLVTDPSSEAIMLP